MRKHLTGLFVGLAIACTMAYGASRVLDVLRFRASSLPATCTDGELRLDTSDNGLKKCLSNTWSLIAGSGGGINYIETTGGKNPDAETDASGWVDFADAAASSPVDGVGGSPTLVISRTTSTPLRGTGSFLLTKDAANRQGEGSGYLFDIDSTDSINVNPQIISFDYSASANFAFNAGTAADPSDITIWIYDVTNAALILPQIQSLDGSGRFVSTFTPASDSTSYRLIFFVPTTNASAWTFKFDNVGVGPGTALATGPPTTDWASFTPTISAVTTAPTPGTTTTNVAYWRRVGDSLEMRVEYVQTGAGSAGTGTYVILFPNSLVADTTKISGSPAVNQQSLGSGFNIGSLGMDTTIQVDQDLNSDWGFTMQREESAAYFGSTTNPLSGTTVTFGFFATVPISGWGTGLETAIVVDSLRPVDMRASGDPASAAAGAPVIWPTADFDTHNEYSVSTGLYTCPVTGKYEILGYVTSGNATITINIAKDGATDVAGGITDGSGEGTFNGLVDCNAGQTISIEPSGTLDVASGHMAIFKTDAGSASAALQPQNKFLTKILTADLTSTQTIADWSETLTIGKVYEVTGLMHYSGSADTDDIFMDFMDGATVVHRAGSFNIHAAPFESVAFKFKATSTAFTVDLTEVGAITLIGDGGLDESYIQITESNDTIEVSGF